VAHHSAISAVTKHIEHVTGSVVLSLFYSGYKDLAEFWERLKVVGGEGDFTNTTYCRDIRNRDICQR